MIERTDWQGRPIPKDETDDTKILVWCIDPGIVGYDQTWVRDYQQAIEAAQEILAQNMDDLNEKDAKAGIGVSVSIRLVETTVGEMKAIDAQEP